MFIGGMANQLNAYINYPNNNRPIIKAIIKQNGNNSVQEISRQEDGFCKCAVYILIWLVIWVLFRMMTSVRRRGINRGRDDLRK